MQVKLQTVLSGYLLSTHLPSKIEPDTQLKPETKIFCRNQIFKSLKVFSRRQASCRRQAAKTFYGFCGLPKR